MHIFKKKTDLNAYLSLQRSQGATVGFVPTMGALHQGHIALVRKAVAENTLTVCSIFVNPTQFNNAVDFEKYPITIELDIDLLIQAQCDVLFLPEVVEMYPEGLENNKQYDLGFLETVLEGYYRPGHFQGVCIIVHKLLDAVKPNNLYMGAKDFQQCMVVKKLLALESISTTLHICPTLRESSGLAMSSRNMRLSAEGKTKAVTIYTCLQYIKQHQHQNWQAVKEYCHNMLLHAGLEPEYIALAHAHNLQLLDNFVPEHPMVALIVAYLEGVRLIDNMVLTDDIN